MSEEIQKFLTSQDKQVHDARSVLSRLFRIILADLKVGPLLWNRLMLRYLNDSRNNIPNNSKDRSSSRGNLSKELRRTIMTWKVFEKGIRFLGPKWMRITIDLGWPSGRVTTHRVMVPTHRRAVDDEDDVFGENNPVDPGKRRENIDTVSVEELQDTPGK